MNSTSKTHSLSSLRFRVCQWIGLLTAITMLHGFAHAQVTLGDPLITGFSDNASGGVYLYTGTFGQAGTADVWSFFDADGASRSVTPLLFQKLDSSTFQLTGVGTAVTTTAGGTQTGYSFGLIAGSATVGSDYTFGFTDRDLSYSGSGDSLTTGSSNTGVVDFQTSGGIWAFVPAAEGSFNIILGQNYVINAATGGDDSTVSLFGTFNRQYSAQLTAVPEPATVSVWLGLIALFTAGLIRRHNRSRT